MSTHGVSHDRAVAGDGLGPFLLDRHQGHATRCRLPPLPGCPASRIEKPADLLYFSFTVLTGTGFGDIVPVLRQSRALCVVEHVVGALFLAVLIARLAGLYPPREDASNR